jgi:hypothetical protein
MALDRGGVVAQRLGQDRNGGQLREFVKCAESRGACAEDVTKSVAEVTGVDVAAGGVAPKDPVAVGVRRCQVVAGVHRQLPPGFIERAGQGDLDRSDAHAHQIVSDYDLIPGEADDILDLLAEHKDEDRRRAVAWGEFLSVNDSLDRMFLVYRVHSWAGAAAVALDLQIGTNKPCLHRPAEKAVGDQPGGWPGDLPSINVLLFKFSELDPVTSEPVQEISRDGDRLLAPQEGALRDLVHLVHPALLLPADGAANHLAVDGVYEPVERVPGPLVVASVVGVSLGARNLRQPARTPQATRRTPERVNLRRGPEVHKQSPRPEEGVLASNATPVPKCR